MTAMRMAAILTVAASILAADVMAQGPGMGDGQKGRREGLHNPMRGSGNALHLGVIGRLLENKKLAAEIGLTDAQKETLEDARFDLESQKIKLQADLKLAALEQARLISREDVDEVAMMEAVEKTGGIRTEMAKLHIKGVLLVKETLSEEQRDKIRDIMQKRMRRESRNPRERKRSRPGKDESRSGEDEPGAGEATGQP